MKSVKNETELKGFHSAMVKDGVALVKFYMWLEKAIPTGKVNEVTIADKLYEFRSQQALFVGESFAHHRRVRTQWGGYSLPCSTGNRAQGWNRKDYC